jgi:hypothetical protein
MSDELKDAILSIFEASLEAQLRAVRRLRRSPESTPASPRHKVMSQVDMAYDVLRRARAPLHISEIIARIQHTFGISVDRDSLASSLTKKVVRSDRFTRPAKNTFGLLAASQ